MPADAQRSVLVVDDDRRFAITLATGLARRG
jgi:ActR/RegA family two-component response regulator